MSKISAIKNRETVAPGNGIKEIYGEKTLGEFLSGRLVEKQNLFNMFLTKIEEESKNKTGAEVKNIIPETVETIKKYATQLAQDLETKEQKDLFMRFAQSRGSKTLISLKKYSEREIEEYKRSEILAYCDFLLKSSEELYDDPVSLSENAAYYAGYISALPEYAGTDTQSRAEGAIYSAAIEGALEKNDPACAKAFLADKSIFKKLPANKTAYYAEAISALEEKNTAKAIIKSFDPQTEEELKRDIASVETAGKSGVISQENVKTITEQMRLIYNVNANNRKTLETQTQERETAALLNKIIKGLTVPQDIVSANLPKNVKDMINRAMETENMKNTKILRARKKIILDKLLEAARTGEILSISDGADFTDGPIDTAGLFLLLKALREYRNSRYDF